MPFASKPKYTYHPNGKNWRVYKNTYDANGAESGHPVGYFFNKEEARAEVYRLNGWKLKNYNKK